MVLIKIKLSEDINMNNVIQVKQYFFILYFLNMDFSFTIQDPHSPFLEMIHNDLF